MVLPDQVCGVGFGTVDGGRAGAVTERFTTMPRGIGAGPVPGAREERRGKIYDPLAACVWGRTGNGRKKGFGVVDMRRDGKLEGVVLSVAVDAGRLPMVDWGRSVGGFGAGSRGGGDKTLFLDGGALELLVLYRGYKLWDWRTVLCRE